MSKRARTPRLDGIYHQYLIDQDAAAFVRNVAQRYTVGTLERLADSGERMTRRAAVLALGHLAEYESNAALGQRSCDDDRGVRMLADNGIRQLWCRAGSPQDRQQLQTVMELNAARQFSVAIDAANELVERLPTMAEAWNQRAVAFFLAGRFVESIRDCRQALEINPYHFGAASGMAQCYLKLGDRRNALSCFRRALRAQSDSGRRATQVLYLQRTLKSQE